MFVQDQPRVGTAIGDKALDLFQVAKAGLLDGVKGLENPSAIFGEVRDIQKKEKHGRIKIIYLFFFKK